MLNLIADYPFWFALFVIVITGVPTAIWWRWYSKKQATKALLQGIKFSCICGKNFTSKLKLDGHQQDGSCPKHPIKKTQQSQTKPKTVQPTTVNTVKKPSPLQKQVLAEQQQKNKGTISSTAKPKAIRKSIKIKPRKKTTEKKKEEDVISIGKFAKSNAKISISKR